MLNIFIGSKKGGDMLMAQWMSDAERLFYNEGYRIIQISELLGMTRQTIANHLKKTSGYIAEKAKRKEETRERKKEQNREWAKNNPEKKSKSSQNWINKNRGRKKSELTDFELLQIDHIRAVRELSQSLSSHKSIRNEMCYYRSAYKQGKSGYRRINVTENGALVPIAGMPKYVK